MEYRNFLQLLFRQIDRKKLTAWDLFYFPEYFLGEKQRYWSYCFATAVQEHTSEPALSVPSQTHGPVEFPRGRVPGQCEASASIGTAVTEAISLWDCLAEFSKQKWWFLTPGALESSSPGKEFWFFSVLSRPLNSSSACVRAPGGVVHTHISKAQQMLENLGYILFLGIVSVLSAPWRLSLCLLLMPPIG